MAAQSGHVLYTLHSTRFCTFGADLHAQCLLTKFLHWSSPRRSLRVPCWLDTVTSRHQSEPKCGIPCYNPTRRSSRQIPHHLQPRLIRIFWLPCMGMVTLFFFPPRELLLCFLPTRQRGLSGRDPKVPQANIDCTRLNYSLCWWLTLNARSCPPSRQT